MEEEEDIKKIIDNNVNYDEFSINELINELKILKKKIIITFNFAVDIYRVSNSWHPTKFVALKDYELGYVKEGVGAGALALLAQLQGASCEQLLEACDQAMNQLLGTSCS